MDAKSLFQSAECMFLKRALLPITGKVSETGLDALIESCDSGRQLSHSGNGLIFVSNHRNIFMDPGLIGYVLTRRGYETPHLAVGANLFTDAVAKWFLGMNKGFPMTRSNRYRGLKKPYEHIRKLSGERESIWIAQRAGRAKDGDDTTDPKIARRLYGLPIVPVSISYEFDPTILTFARVQECEKRGVRYKKRRYEDGKDMLRGVFGYKGGMHIHFGNVVNAQSAAELSLELDRQIKGNYTLWGSNLVAYSERQSSGQDNPVDLSILEQVPRLARQVSKAPRELQPYIAAIYAKPAEIALSRAAPR